jgi:hypothetical protein
LKEMMVSEKVKKVRKERQVVKIVNEAGRQVAFCP